MLEQFQDYQSPDAHSTLWLCPDIGFMNVKNVFNSLHKKKSAKADIISLFGGEIFDFNPVENEDDGQLANYPAGRKLSSDEL